MLKHMVPKRSRQSTLHIPVRFNCRANMNQSNTTRVGKTEQTNEEKAKEDMFFLNRENDSATIAPKSVITDVKKKRALPDAKDNLRTQIAMIRAQREMANKAHEKYVQEVEQRIRVLHARINMLRKDFHKHAVVHRYAADLKNENVPSYIVVLQAKLCREVHNMCVDEAQLKLAKRLNRKLVKFANKQCMDLEQEKSLIEVQMLNSMAEVEIQQKELQQEYSEKLREQRMAVADIQMEISQVPAIEEKPTAGIDSIMDRLSMLNANMKKQEEPQDELTLEDLKKCRENSHQSLDDMLGESEKSLQNSWNAPFTGKKEGRAERRGSGLLGAKIWMSEKVWM